MNVQEILLRIKTGLEPELKYWLDQPYLQPPKGHVICFTPYLMKDDKIRELSGLNEAEIDMLVNEYNHWSSSLATDKNKRNLYQI